MHLELIVHVLSSPSYAARWDHGKKERGVGYTHLPQDTRHYQLYPENNQAYSDQSPIVATPIAGHTSATKPSITAIMPTISIPGVPRAATANPRTINVKATSQPRVNPP